MGKLSVRVSYKIIFRWFHDSHVIKNIMQNIEIDSNNDITHTEQLDTDVVCCQ